MQQVNQKTLGVNVVISGVPSTASEFDEMAGEVGACVNVANDNIVYRSWLAKFRAAFVLALEAKTGIARLTTGEGDAAVISEKDTSYVKRLELEEGVTKVTLQEVSQATADAIPFAIHAVSSSRVAKRFLDSADEIMATIESAHGNDYSKFVGNITERNTGFNFVFDEDGNPTRDSVAHALKTEEERIKREATASVLA